uniref:ORF12 n=1 Tax=Nitrosopumilaceae spindle-shaped virus TaxID=3065433 RepID=A0AAT9JG46_9VIRU
MIGTCNFIDDNDNRCNKTYNLQGIIFLNPETPSIIERIDLCKLHYGMITDDHTQRVRAFQMALKNTISENQKRKQIARANDTFYEESLMLRKIADLRELLSSINVSECKNYLCMANISKIDQYKKIYTVITLKPSNKVQYKFYFCSLRCFNIFKARCGILQPIQHGQMILNG